MTIPSISNAVIDAYIFDKEEVQRTVKLFRDYYQGNHYLDGIDDRLSEFLQSHDDISPFRFNVCKTVVSSIANELDIVNFETGENFDAERSFDSWIAKLTSGSAFSSLQNRVHKWTLIDGYSFIVVDFDAATGMPIFRHAKLYLSEEAGGTGEGIFPLYLNNDVTQPLVAAAKMWNEATIIDDETVFVKRRTVYYEDRIERFVMIDGEWEPFIDSAFPQWPISWVNADGSPIGIPVVDFINEDETSELSDIVPMQDVITKTLIDIVSANDLTAFRMYFAYGFFPTIDGQEPNADRSNIIRMGPGQVNGTTKSRTEADVQVVDGADTRALMDSLKEFVLMTAQLAAIPVNHFIMTGQVASSETLKDQEKPFKRKTKLKRSLFGAKWERAILTAAAVYNALSPNQIDSDTTVSTVWRHADTGDDISLKQSLGVPQELLWQEVGYNDEELRKIKSTTQYKLELYSSVLDIVSKATAANVDPKPLLLAVGLTEKEIASFIVTEPPTPDTQDLASQNASK